MNKYQEAKSNIANTLVRVEGFEAYRNLYDKSFTVLQELIDKQEKYRWHDLRKNPNDLPKLNTKVLFAIVYFKELIGYGVATFSEKGFEDGINPPSLIKEFAIAWKYIEEIE